MLVQINESASSVPSRGSTVDGRTLSSHGSSSSSTYGRGSGVGSSSPSVSHAAITIDGNGAEGVGACVTAGDDARDRCGGGSVPRGAVRGNGSGSEREGRNACAPRAE